MSLNRFSCAGLWLVCIVCLSGCGREDLAQSKAALNQAWAGVEQVNARRLDAIPAALDAARKTPGIDPQLLDAVSRALEAASRVPADAPLQEDPLVFDRYKQTQGELTGAAFRLLSAAESSPDLRQHPAIGRLRTAMINDQAQLSAQRARYSEALAHYNALVQAFPTRLTAWVFGFELRGDFVNRAAGG